jgi:spore photoproduct lyase family protein
MTLESLWQEEIAVSCAPNLPKNLLDIDTIYHEPNVSDFARGREILAKFPDAKRIEVGSHWNLPGLNGNAGNASDWLKIKRHILVLGVRKALKMEPNSRSSDFIAPSTASGCALSCAYCYVPRHKGFANPITTFVNSEQIALYIARHAAKQGHKAAPTPADDHLWVYELGCNSDTSIDAAISLATRDLVEQFKNLPNAKATFATKWVNRDLLNYDPQGKTRIRFSLMPHRMAKLLDVRTSPISERIAAINDFVEAGFEVNLNFSPVVIEDGFLDAYDELFEEVNDALSPRARAQMVAEIIFLTHHAGLHEVNLEWHPRAEDVLWQPNLQETKISNMGGRNIRYKVGLKQPLVAQFCERLRAKMPYCEVRYAF